MLFGCHRTGCTAEVHLVIGIKGCDVSKQRYYTGLCLPGQVSHHATSIALQLG